MRQFCCGMDSYYKIRRLLQNAPVHNTLHLTGDEKRESFSRDLNVSLQLIKGIIMQIWKFANVFFFMWKTYVEGFTLKHLLLFEICQCKICEKFIYKHSETIEYVKN